MTTLTHQRLATPTTPEAACPDRTALYEAAGAEPLSWRERLRLPFVRPRSVRALIHRYRLWPALEFAYDEIVREFGRPVRVKTMRVHTDFDGSLYLTVEFLAPTVEIEPVFEFESALDGLLGGRFGRKTARRLSITIHRDPDYLPLFA